MVQSNGNIKLVDYDNCRHIVSKQGDVVDCIGTPEFTGKNLGSPGICVSSFILKLQIFVTFLQPENLVAMAKCRTSREL